MLSQLVDTKDHYPEAFNALPEGVKAQVNAYRQLVDLRGQLGVIMSMVPGARDLFSDRVNVALGYATAGFALPVRAVQTVAASTAMAAKVMAVNFARGGVTANVVINALTSGGAAATRARNQRLSSGDQLVDAIKAMGVSWIGVRGDAIPAGKLKSTFRDHYNIPASVTDNAIVEAFEGFLGGKVQGALEGAVAQGVSTVPVSGGGVKAKMSSSACALAAAVSAKTTTQTRMRIVSVSVPRGSIMHG